MDVLSRQQRRSFSLQHSQEDVSYTSDPRALQFILQTSAYTFEKMPMDRFIISQVMGAGIVGVERKMHSSSMSKGIHFSSVR